jgi:ubiquinol-cytochrome c reductase iron-sulfur subunit
MTKKKTETGADPTRREFIHLTATAMGAVGLGAAVWPLVNSMNPSEDVMALSTIDVDISQVPQGKTMTVIYRGKPVFVRHRTEAEVKSAREASLKSLPDPETDQKRTEKPEWLVVVGVCTHLGCIPNQRTDLKAGEEGGWFCACHGSKYDSSGRIVSGPAPRNLEVPDYEFVSDNLLRIGTKA